MALGYANNNYSSGARQQQEYTPTVYSQYSMVNPTSKIDPSRLSFSFWNGLLKVSITPVDKSTLNSNIVKYDSNNAIAIHLSAVKARVLYNEINKFLENPDKYYNAGVSTPKGCIYISNGKEFNSNSKCLVISLIDENGNPTSTFVYEFNADYQFGIRNFNPGKADFIKNFNDYSTIEIEEFKDLLKEYYTSMTNATAYSVINQYCKYEQIKDKYKNGSYAGKNTSNFFNSNGSTETSNGTAKQSDYDSFLSEFEADEEVPF